MILKSEDIVTITERVVHDEHLDTSLFDKGDILLLKFWCHDEKRITQVVKVIVERVNKTDVNYRHIEGKHYTDSFCGYTCSPKRYFEYLKEIEILLKGNAHLKPKTVD